VLPVYSGAGKMAKGSKEKTQMRRMLAVVTVIVSLFAAPAVAAGRPAGGPVQVATGVAVGGGVCPLSPSRLL
jgi:hypothetical protein